MDQAVHLLKSCSWSWCPSWSSCRSASPRPSPRLGPRAT